LKYEHLNGEKKEINVLVQFGLHYTIWSEVVRLDLISLYELDNFTYDQSIRLHQMQNLAVGPKPIFQKDKFSSLNSPKSEEFAMLFFKEHINLDNSTKIFHLRIKTKSIIGLEPKFSFLNSTWIF